MCYTPSHTQEDKSVLFTCAHSKQAYQSERSLLWREKREIAACARAVPHGKGRMMGDGLRAGSENGKKKKKRNRVKCCAKWRLENM